MKIALGGGHYPYRIQHLIRLFIPQPEFVPYPQEGEAYIVTDISPTGTLKVEVSFPQLSKSLTEQGKGLSEKETQQQLCTMLFMLLSEAFSYKPSWGMLIGVRPLSIYFRLKEEGKSDAETLEIFLKEYFIAPEKASHLVETGQNQERIRQLLVPRGCSLYVSIPFCPTRCRYCSFVSHSIQNTEKLIPEYLRLLKKEITVTLGLVKELGLTLQSVYIGGGTPTSLSYDQLKDLLQHLHKELPTSQLLEYTLEGGRPDTIDRPKLQIAHSLGVDRISINPQTLNPLVLKEIGRGHSVKEFYTAFDLGKKQGFKVINADLIAGLPGEEEESFLAGLDKAIELAPENITIHTLTLKRSSTLKEEGAEIDTPFNVPPTLDKAYKKLDQKGYSPYYLYRQKNTRQHQENTGFSAAGCESLYNVAMMEDLQTVFGVGAGATTKIVGEGQKKIGRIYNHKYPYEYCGEFQSLLERKRKIKEHYERN